MKDGFEGFCRDCRDYNAGHCPTWGKVPPNGVCGIPSWRRGNRSFAEEAARYAGKCVRPLDAAVAEPNPRQQRSLFAPGEGKE